MNFEYDPRKSAANKTKHGIDFSQAQALWFDERALEIEVITLSERRSIVIGKISGKCWTAVITYRKENIRLISVRRSRPKEVDIYEENQSS